jgi:hypothetical protein
MIVAGSFCDGFLVGPILLLEIQKFAWDAERGTTTTAAAEESERRAAAAAAVHIGSVIKYLSL